jgi:hypothetical protein
MSKGIHRRDFEDGELERLAYLASAAKDPLPHGSELLRAFLRASIRRVERTDPKAAKFGRMIGQLLAGTERMPGYQADPDEFGKTVCEPLLRDFANGDLSRVRHAPMIIEAQRGLLAHYLTENPYPTGITARRWGWVKEHWPAILNLIALLPCMCEYNRILGGDYDPAEEDHAPDNQLNSVTVPTFSTQQAIVDAMLAHLHENTTPQEIQRLLKPSSR